MLTSGGSLEAPIGRNSAHGREQGPSKQVGAVATVATYRGFCKLNRELGEVSLEEGRPERTLAGGGHDGGGWRSKLNHHKSQ